MNPVPVVAAIIERDGRFLVGRRPAHKRHGGLWEFPGGKVDDGETVAEAARRELDEELTLSVVAVEDRLHHVDDAGGRLRHPFSSGPGGGRAPPTRARDPRVVHPG